MYTVIDGKQIHVTHITADGKVRESMAGYLTNVDQLPLVTQRILIQMMTNTERTDNDRKP